MRPSAEPPLAFVEKQRGAMRIVALDAAALAQGLAPGLTLADARAAIPELAAVDHDPLADRLWLERLADGCDRWTPMVALDPPDGITLDVSGCVHLFGGEAAFAADIERRFALAGIHLRQAIAASPEAAQALARFQTMPAADEARRSAACRSRRCGSTTRSRSRCAAPGSRRSAISPTARPRRSPRASARRWWRRSIACSAAPTAASCRAARCPRCCSSAASPSRSRAPKTRSSCSTN